MYRFITTYSPKQYEVYGRKLIESIEQYSLVDPLVEWIFVEQQTLMADEDLLCFLDTWGSRKIAHGVVGNAIEYRLQAVRFAYKVFCYTDPMWSRDLGPDDWLVWLDADTIFTAQMTEDWLARVCPDGSMGSYIGRKDWDHSECGFMGFSMANHGREFLRKMRTFYTEDLIFGQAQWHDSFIFDRVRGAMELKYERQWHNLAKGIGGNHPWPETALGEILEHHKGPQAKKAKYGEVA